MDPILDKAHAAQNFLERIANKIPLFKGYRDKELRRDADRLQREYLADRLDEAKREFNDISTAITRSGNLDAINDVETARKRLDKVANRIRYADRGYTGFFSAVKVDETALARVYEFDMGLIDGVDSVLVGARAASSGDAVAELRQVISRIDALDRHLEEREAILRGIQ